MFIIVDASALEVSLYQNDDFPIWYFESFMFPTREAALEHLRNPKAGYPEGNYTVIEMKPTDTIAIKHKVSVKIKPTEIEDFKITREERW